MSAREYMVLQHSTPRRAAVALAARFERLEDAWDRMGDGLIVRHSTGEVVAFHERHERMVRLLRGRVVWGK